jgi:hypothetical protein
MHTKLRFTKGSMGSGTGEWNWGVELANGQPSEDKTLFLPGSFQDHIASQYFTLKNLHH